MGFGTHFVMGTYQALFEITTVALKICASSTLVLGQLGVDALQTIHSSGRQIFAIPEL